MFEKVLSEVKEEQGTEEEILLSETLIPEIRATGEGRILVLKNRETNKEHRCLRKGWESWCDKVIKPSQQMRRDMGMQEGAKWSNATIRRLLEMTPLSLANNLVKTWWARMQPTNWNVIKYVDNGNPGDIRFIGTPRYRLYRHEDFIRDLKGMEGRDFDIQQVALTENNLIVRITGRKPLIDQQGFELFAGYQLMNSENGSSSIQIKHLIYDLICTNGMIVNYEDKTLMSQRHTGFNMDDFREDVKKIGDESEEAHESAVGAVESLVSHGLDKPEAIACYEMFRKESMATNDLIDGAKKLWPSYSSRYGSNAWSLLSTTTEAAQKYDWQQRVAYESSAGSIRSAILNRDYEPYIEVEESDEDDGGRSKPGDPGGESGDGTGA